MSSLYSKNLMNDKPMNYSSYKIINNLLEASRRKIISKVLWSRFKFASKPNGD